MNYLVEASPALLTQHLPLACWDHRPVPLWPGFYGGLGMEPRDLCVRGKRSTTLPAVLCAQPLKFCFVTLKTAYLESRALLS